MNNMLIDDKLYTISLDYNDLMNKKIAEGSNVTLNDIRKCTGTGGGLFGKVVRNFNRLVAFTTNKGWITDKSVDELLEKLINEKNYGQLEDISEKMKNLKEHIKKLNESGLNKHWDPEKKASVEIKQLKQQTGTLARLGKQLGKESASEVSPLIRAIQDHGQEVSGLHKEIKATYQQSRALENAITTISRADPVIDINAHDTPVVSKLFSDYLQNNDRDLVGHVDLSNHKRAITQFTAFVKELSDAIKKSENFDIQGLQKDADFLQANAFRHLPY